MALLDLSFISGLKISVAHVNYQLRGAENQQEIKIIKRKRMYLLNGFWLIIDYDFISVLPTSNEVYHSQTNYSKVHIQNL